MDNILNASECYIIGNPDKFAIQFSINRFSKNKYAFGFIIYWINGDSLGYWNNEVYLNEFYSHFHSFIYGSSGALFQNINLFKLDFNSILENSRKMYLPEIDESIEKFDEDYYSVVVDITTNSLERAHIIFLDQETMYKVRYWELRDTCDIYGELVLEKKYFKKVLKSFMHFFENKLVNERQNSIDI